MTTGRLGGEPIPFSAGELALAGIAAFFASAYLRQIPHLSRHPGDFWYAPIFALITSFVVRPVEWCGNLTFLRQDWLTRNAGATAAAPEPCAPSRAPVASPPP